MPQGVALWAGYSVKCLVPYPCVSILPSLVTSRFNTKLFWYKFIESTCKLFHILGLWNEEYIIFLPVADPDLGGGGASSPWDKGGPVLNKKIFQPFRPQLGPKKGGAGPSPGSATACSHRNYTWSDQNFCAISLLEFVSKCLVLKRLVTPSPFSSPAWGKMQWNLDITECQRRGKIFLLQWGFVISRYFSINFTITGVKKIVRYTEDFLR